MELRNQIAIITGGAQGIGKAIAILMAKEGAKVMIADINPETTESTIEELRNSGYEAEFVICDVCKKEGAEYMVKETLNKFGKLDILVNNAGFAKVKPIDEMSEVDWDSCMDIKSKAIFLCTQAAVKVMKQQNKGCIITMTSIAAFIGMPERGPYSFSSAGIVGLTRTLAAELGRNNIRVNAIAAGFTLTQGFERMVSLGVVDKETLVKLTPLHELVKPEDIANAAVFLASEKSRLITGITLPVEGGWLSDGTQGMIRPSEQKPR